MKQTKWIAAGLLAGALFAHHASAGIDVTFMIDESGSMGDDQADVAAGAGAIFAGLPAGSHGAVIGYGSNSPAPRVVQQMTPDSATFAAGVNALVTSGYLEQGFRVTYETATDTIGNGTVGYTSDPVCHILITDESPDQGGRTLAEATNAVVTQGAVFFGILPNNLHGVIQPLATATGGQLFDLGAFRNDPTPVLEAVIAACVEAVIPVALDIKPTSCPNPVKLPGKGVLPTALLGSEEFDVTSINPDSLVLNGECPAVRSEIEDVATPYDGEYSDPVVENECTTEGADGFDDLTVKFDKECAGATTDLTERDAEFWEVCGTYKNEDGDDVEFCASDVVRIMP